MQYVLSVIFAALLVVAQSSWKTAVNATGSPFKTTVSVASLSRFVFTPLVLLGIILYAVAMLLYMYLLSKYEFSLIQSLAIPISLIFSILVALVFFGETLTPVNYLGLFCIICGIVLITMR